MVRSYPKQAFSTLSGIYLFICLWLLIPSLVSDVMLDDYPEISVTQPDDPFLESLVYIDKITLAQILDTTDVFEVTVFGHLPESCSQLLRASISFKNDMLDMDLASWRPRDAMCLQSLKPFRHSMTLRIPSGHSIPKTWLMQDQNGIIQYETRK